MKKSFLALGLLSVVLISPIPKNKATSQGRSSGTPTTQCIVASNSLEELNECMKEESLDTDLVKEYLELVDLRNSMIRQLIEKSKQSERKAQETQKNLDQAEMTIVDLKKQILVLSKQKPIVVTNAPDVECMKCEPVVIISSRDSIPIKQKKNIFARTWRSLKHIF